MFNVKFIAYQEKQKHIYMPTRTGFKVHAILVCLWVQSMFTHE